MSSQKTINFDGLELPYECKGTCDYLNSLDAEKLESSDEEVWADIISNNPSGIDGYIEFSEALIKASTLNYIANYSSKEKQLDLTKLRNSIEIINDRSKFKQLEKKDDVLYCEKTQEMNDESNFIKKTFEDLMSIKGMKEIYSGLECLNSNIPHAAIANIEAFYREVFLSETKLRVILRATEIAANRHKAQISGSKGAKKRWEPKEKTKQFAIELYHEGTFKNPSQAAEKLTEQIFEYGKSVGFHFSGLFQANKTIYKWLLDT